MISQALRRIKSFKGAILQQSRKDATTNHPSSIRIAEQIVVPFISASFLLLISSGADRAIRVRLFLSNFIGAKFIPSKHASVPLRPHPSLSSPMLRMYVRAIRNCLYTVYD